MMRNRVTSRSVINEPAIRALEAEGQRMFPASSPEPFREADFRVAIEAGDALAIKRAVG
jgi:hypothetical protein